MTDRTRILLAGMIGNVVEWYDFGLYGLLASLLASLFFPSHDRIAQDPTQVWMVFQTYA